MTDGIDVVYNKDTNIIAGVRMGDEWILPSGLAVAKFRNGAMPAILSDQKGRLKLKTNSIIYIQD